MNKQIVLPELTVYVSQDNKVVLAKNNRTGCFEKLSYAQEYYELYTKAPICLSWDVVSINKQHRDDKLAVLLTVIVLVCLFLITNNAYVVASVLVMYAIFEDVIIKGYNKCINYLIVVIRKVIQSTVYKGA